MNSKFHPVSLEVASTTKDAYNREVTTFTHDRYIDAFISTRAGSTSIQNLLQITNSSHLALTPVRGIQPTTNRLNASGRLYIIDYVIDDGRYSQLFLKAVE